MKKAIIIGCGFGGLSACARLAGLRKELAVTVIDRGEYFHFLPLLPDVIGRGIDPCYLRFPISALAAKFGFNYVRDEVRSLDLTAKAVLTQTKRFDYDYLLIASGSETNFYGNQAVKNCAFKLDDCFDAGKLRRELAEPGFDTLVVVGGGYTGVEIATNAQIYFNRRGINKKVIIVERQPRILGPLPAWMRDYVSANLKSLRIEVKANTVVDSVAGKKLCLSGCRPLEAAILVWAAGVKTSGFIDALAVAKTPQGRIKVDEFLRINGSAFAIGDAASVDYKQQSLRMAVQFAITQGGAAAENIARQMRGAPLSAYRPLDMGYLIPMANNRSCGIVLGMRMTGLAATFFHYLMCLYRSYSWKNRWGVIRGLLCSRPPV